MELLPLLDILANNVKTIRRLRELLTTKPFNDTFPPKLSGCMLLNRFLSFETGDQNPLDVPCTLTGSDLNIGAIKGRYNLRGMPSGMLPMIDYL
ncbi:ankyrin repeat domain-containing protein 13C [Artemisia annua]|uniref:Ankyrin repeat domain-containing protein 13C n=1 Tax=Artemisia annua TaxID=35608 RepID=A0A2U1PHT5_ARTAN|nr:ankyrin repeat domain-containing protein 13C [Artemisia annua]